MGKKFFSGIKEKLKRPIEAVKRKVEPCAEFLASGRLGGIIAMVLLGAQFDIMDSLCELPYPKPVTMILSAALTVVVVEVLLLLVRLILGGKRRSIIYFLFTLVLVFYFNYYAVQDSMVLTPLFMTLPLVLAVDVLGRCVVAFIRQRRFKQVFGYVACGLSLVIMVLYGLFFHIDNFGESRITFYLDAAPKASAQAATGFDNYLADGSFEVRELSYGNSDDSDIRTGTIDISDLETLRGRDIYDKISAIGSNYDFSKTPIKGEIYYPADQSNCPTLIMVHGAHRAEAPSYLGYAYLGRYLASNGYVVVSVDENICNDLNVYNDARAIIFLENIKTILGENNNASSPLYRKIDPHKLAIAGHSRGGEAVATAYLFNDLDVYPDDGNLKFNYHFDIAAVIAISPTVDQYTPADHAVKITDVNYLLMHGANDQDVVSVMGEKQYKNVTFTGGGKELFRKASVYILGANHGQFNSEWGRYDLIPSMRGYLNTANFITQEDQQKIAKAYIRTFLDASLGIDDTYSGLLSDNSAYLSYLPETVYVTDYMDSSFENVYSFEDSVDILSGDKAGTTVDCEDMANWTFRPDIYGNGGEGENYVLSCYWDEKTSPAVVCGFDADMTSGGISFRLGDMASSADNPSGLFYKVELTDADGRTVSAEEPVYVYPSLAVQLFKQDVFFGGYEYKRQMQLVRLTPDMFGSGTEFDFGHVKKMKIYFDGSSYGEVIIDNIGVFN